MPSTMPTFVVPAGINTNTNHQIVVQRDNTLSIPVAVDIGPVEPAIFGYPLPGDPPTQGAIVNAVTYAVAHPGTPVGAGDVVAIFCTGLGAVDKNVPDGAAAPASPLANTVATPAVTIGGDTEFWMDVSAGLTAQFGQSLEALSLGEVDDK